jgi:hypothetical protein
LTLAVGMIPSREPGVVLIADTVGSFFVDGRRRLGRDDRKLLWVHGQRLAVAISGPVNDDGLSSIGIGPEYVPAGARRTVFECVQQTFRAILEVNAEVKARHRADPEPFEHDLPDPSPHVLFAGGPLAEQPQLARLTPLSERWAEPGDTLSIGSWLIALPDDLAEEMARPAPASLDDCIAVAADWVRRRIHAIVGDRPLEQFQREMDFYLTFGFPLRAIIITPDTVTTQEISR